MLTQEQWEKIQKAVQLVEEGVTSRMNIESNIVVYAVPPKVIRIDIKK